MLGSLLVILLFLTIFYLALPASKSAAPSAPGVPTTIQMQKPTAGSFNKAKHPLDRAGSLWAVVNKGRRLPADYVPQDLTRPKVVMGKRETLRNEASAALQKMFAAAAKDGLKLKLISGYRSYYSQQSVYGGYVRSVGTAQADTFSARPGFSEHQTGLAADVGATSGSCDLDQCFDATAEGRWLAANCYDFGFIIRYPKDKDTITGYEYEPWHLRYVGSDLSAQIKNTHQTLEQFFGLPIYSSYSSNSITLKQ